MNTLYDVAVIGLGPGGSACALRARDLGLKTCGIDSVDSIGGTCLHVGCIPSKVMLHVTEELFRIKHQNYGLLAKDADIDFATLIKHKRDVVSLLHKGLTGVVSLKKIDIIPGMALFSGPQELLVENRTVHARHIVIATGSKPVTLPFIEIDEKQIVSSTGALSLSEVPKRFLVIGGGVIGVELASVYARLGSQVTIVELLPTICAGIDVSLQKGLHHALQTQGITIHTQAKVTSCKRLGKEVQVAVQLEGREEVFTVDTVLVAVGRAPRTDNLDIEKIGIERDAKGYIRVDGCFRTNIPNIFAIGDCIEGPMLAHRSSEEGQRIADYIAKKPTQLDYITVPNVIYTLPEVATVGFTEEEARHKGFDITVGIAYLKANGRARASGEQEGFVKVIIDAKRRYLLGMHILAAHASEMIPIASLALAKKMIVDDIANLPFAHPTLAESIKEACERI